MSMNERMRAMFQRCGRASICSSTLSPDRVIAGRSVSMLVSRICLGSSGRNGSSSEAPAMLNMLPKFALVAMSTYFKVLAKVSRPSRMPSTRMSRLFSSSTMSATSLATSTASSTDRPTSAACSADASLMPSPM